MCDMVNDAKSSTFNFTVFTGDTIPNRELGSVRDHTRNSTSGGFLYWNQYLPVSTSDRGRVYLSKTIEQNTGMCIQFTYYVKSKLINKNTTVIRLSSDGYPNTGLCAITLYFDVYQLETTLTAVAFDDIVIDQCSSFIPTTASTSTSTKSTSITITSRSTTTKTT
ncbi:unnamed protein product [Rotaria sp. Silwood2]|nr:unnamed protein product [Rotaria sp. Silwood2]